MLIKKCSQIIIRNEHVLTGSVCIVIKKSTFTFAIIFWWGNIGILYPENTCHAIAALRICILAFDH